MACPCAIALLLAIALFSSAAAAPPLILATLISPPSPTSSTATGRTYLRQKVANSATAPPSSLALSPLPVKRRSFALAVEGVVNCQHCKQVPTASLINSTRLAGAKVRLACRNLRYKTFVFKTAYTNAHGYFSFHVEDYDFRLHGGVRSCIVYLISSPSQSCYRVTNINSGRIGAALTRQKVFPDEILYTVGPFAFAPLSCKAPPSYFKLHKTTYRYPTSPRPLF